jgi:hypothetical protein
VDAGLPAGRQVDRLLGEHGLQGDNAETRQEFERRMEAARMPPGDEAGLRALRRGWCLGSAEFKKQKLEEIDGQVGEHHLGSLRLETAELRAERIIEEELRRLGWQETDLMSRRRHDPGKVQIAVRLRRETTLSVKRIAQRLHFGTPKSASFRLLAVMRNQPSADPAQCRLSL